MLENPIVNYPQARLTWLQSQEVAAYYAELRRRKVKPAAYPAIKAPEKAEGSTIDERR